jgi:RHS repeat-associated protein
MKRSLNFCITLIIAVCALQHGKVFAQTFDMKSREWSGKRTGAMIKSCFQTPAAGCDTIVSQVDFFTQPSQVGQLYKIKDLRAFVKFSVNHADNRVDSAYTYQLVYQLRGFKQLNFAGTPDVLTDTLMINYNPDSINAYQDVHMRSYYGYYRIEVKVLDVYDYTANYAAALAGSSSVPPPNNLLSSGSLSPALNQIAENWIIEAGMVLQTFDLKLSNSKEVYTQDMAAIILSPTSSLVPGTNVLRVDWPLSPSQTPVPAMYELEWTFVDDYSASITDTTLHVGAKSAGSLKYDFLANSSRIITNKTSYDLPLVYKRGYLLYRVRMLRPDSLNYLQTKYGPWSNTANTGYVNSTPDRYQISGAHLADNANWNFESSFAEDGKSKQVLGYFDGLLKSRQTLTRFSSRQNELIGAETIYDYEGRAALQTLPVPVMQVPNLSYIPSFALSATTQQPYSAADVDALVSPGASAPSLAALHATSAAAKYYSPQNQLLNTTGDTIIKAIPDAEGYPMMQTQFSPDDPKRVRRQGSAGKTLQLGKGHETSYYYSDPEQDELNKYFGANVGWSPFYEKVITRDPNQELSFSVLNNAGKPVMTGLMGFPDPGNGTTLLNLDSVSIPAPAASLTTSELLSSSRPNGAKPAWSGTQRIFNKSVFREALGGSATLSVQIPAFRPCSLSPRDINLPFQVGLSIQGEYDSLQTTLLTPTTIMAPGGSASGPIIGDYLGSASISAGNLSFGPASVGESKLRYSIEYRPEHLDSAVRQYVRALAAAGNGCANDLNYYTDQEIRALPVDCNNEENEDVVGSSSSGSSPCARYESLMMNQLMPGNTYGAYINGGAAENVVIGNGRSMFAIVGWLPLDTGSGFQPIMQFPDSSQAGAFAPTCWPVFISSNLPYMVLPLNQKIDLAMQYYYPVYAYQYLFDSSFRPPVVVTNLNGTAVQKNLRKIPVREVIELFNEDVAKVFMSFHPEFCRYQARYCDGSDYQSGLQAIPSVVVAQQLHQYQLSDIIDRDPFTAVYLTDLANTRADMGYMTYKLTDNSGNISGEREVSLDYFAYLMTVCDGRPNPSACWGAKLPNTAGGRVPAPAGMLDSLNAQQLELYYVNLIHQYIANRGRKIAMFRRAGFECPPSVSLVDANMELFTEDLDSNGNPRDAPGPPSYADLTNGNILTKIGTATTNSQTLGSALNTDEDYAKVIVRNLLNCRTLSNQNYDEALFQDLYNDLKKKIAFNMRTGANKTWKGGISPGVLKSSILGHNMILDDLCNPFLINYQPSEQSLKMDCATGEPLDFCGLTSGLDLNNSCLFSSLISYNEFLTGLSNSGVDSAVMNENNPFDHLLAVSIGLTSVPSRLRYEWHIDSTKRYQIIFTHGSKSVVIRGSRQVMQNYYESKDGILSRAFYGPTPAFVDSLYQRYGTECGCTRGMQTTIGCYDELSNVDTLKVYGHYFVKKSDISDPTAVSDSAAGLVSTGALRISGLDLPQFDADPADNSRSCMHTCIACNELKDAYKIYQEEVAAPYGIKGRGHPFYERSLRSFMNYYFRNRHFTDEYLDFMKGCNLTDSLFLPQYYGYFQAHAPASGGKIPALLSTIRSLAPASPADTPFASVNRSQAASAEHLNYIQYVDSLGEEHLYLDFTNLYTDERLRPYIAAVTAYLSTPVMSGLSWSFNKINGELPGQDPHTVDVFFSGHNKLFPNPDAGLSVVRGNVTVKDAASSVATAQLSMPFTHYRFSAGPGTTPAALSGMWRKLAADLKDSLQAGTGSTGYLELNSNENFRNSHGNTAADKISYLSYVYGLNGDHDATLGQLRAPIVQANAYTPGPLPVRDVSYLHGIADDNAAPSATLQLKPYNSSPLSTTEFQFLKAILDSCKYDPGKVEFPVYRNYTPDYKLPAVIASGTPFIFATPGARPAPGRTMPGNIQYNARTYGIASVVRVANNSYSFAIQQTSNGMQPRSYHVQIRVPAYINRRSALTYNLVSIQPMVYGDSRRYFSAQFAESGNPGSTFTAIGKTDFDILSSAPDRYENVMLCDEKSENADSIDICYDHLYAQAMQNAEAQLLDQQEALFRSTRQAYVEFLKNSIVETLSVSLPQAKYAVTLYNYDRAGNLIATTPPAGVEAMTTTSSVDPYRAGAAITPVPVPTHRKRSVYTYGAQNQKLSETTPDGGMTRFIYDVAGRLILSQSSRQLPKDQFSYTLYDDQNRPVETGQIAVPAAQIYYGSTHKLGGYISACQGQFYAGQQVSHQEFRNWVAGCIREEVTRTTYDTAMYVFATPIDSVVNNGMSRQDNLRGRVAAVASYQVLAAGFTGYTSYGIALHYSYDLSGNLRTLTYDMPGLAAYRQRYKRIDYDYDLYSGKVTLVSYNRGFADQFYQRYGYDDDNRITRTETSRDGMLWERDAAYQYYPHGPLARISLGDQRVQGVDFAYTLQGWLKAINGDSPGDPADIGGDGTGNNAHQRDLFRTTLSYFDGDYKPLSATDATYAPGSKLLKLPAPPAVNRSLYNGNITAMATLPGYFAPLYSAYRYDKLNRIKSADYTVPDYGSSTPLANGTPASYGINGPVSRMYHSDYTYDLDGNLSALNRYGFRSGTGNWSLSGGQVYLMDSLHYHYFSGNRTNNKLTNFTDDADHSLLSGGFGNDLAKYNPFNADSLLRLQYDASGNLVQDLSNGLTSIKWNLYGKTREVIKDDGHVLRFGYDPLGNRFSKTTITATAGIDSILNTEYYIREASGNVLATYRLQQHYHYYNIVDRITAIPGMAGLLAPGLAANGSFGGMIASGAERVMPEGFKTAKIYGGSVTGYIAGNSGAMAALMSATPSFSARLLSYAPAIVPRLYPAGPGASLEPFMPLADGITDSAELDRSAALLFSGFDSLSMRYRYSQLHPLEADRSYSSAFMGNLLADDIREWRTLGEGVALQRLQGLVADTFGMIYNGAVRNLLRDSLYVKHPLGADTAQTLDGRLRQALAGIAVAKQDAFVPGGDEYGTTELIDSFMSQTYTGGAAEAAIGRLRQSLGDGALLNTVYNQNPAAFVNSLLTDVSNGGGTPAAKQIVSDALRVAYGGSPASEAVGSIGEIGSPMALFEAASTIDPGSNSTLEPIREQLLDYDRFYLAEHHMYGSSRLGIKKYWPYQYRYEWFKAKTLAQNKAYMDSSEISYRYPWYYNSWQSLVGANYVDPSSHPNLTSRYVARTLGQKSYELTNHLGNVMAVVSDKVSEQKAVSNAALPALAVKRAGLGAAYDYYPFGMQMPSRVVEDATVQCIPVSRTRRVDKIFSSTEKVRTWYLATGVGQVQPATFEGTGGNTSLTYRNIAGRFSTPVYNVDFKGNSYANLALDAKLSLGIVPAGTSGIMVDYAITENNHPLITGYDRIWIGPGSLSVELRNLSRPGVNGQSLVVATRTGPGSGQVQAPPGMVQAGDSIRLVLHYDAPPLPWSLPYTSQQAQFTVTTVVSNILKPVDQQYVALSCDTDGAYAAGYRFGFNGQMKDDEMKGKGNSLDFGARMYDSRLGRFLSRDPDEAKYPDNSTYAAFNNSPIAFTDPTGRGAIAKLVHSAGQPPVIHVYSTVHIYSHVIKNAQLREYGQKIESDINNQFNNVAVVDKSGKILGQSRPQMEYQGRMIDVEFHIKVEVTDPVTAGIQVKENAEQRGMQDNWMEVGIGGGSRAGKNTGYYDVEQLSKYGSTDGPHEFGHLLGYFRTILGDDGGDDADHANGVTEPYSIMARPDGATKEDMSKRRVTQMDIRRLNHGRGGSWEKMKGPIPNRDFSETATMGDGVDAKLYEVPGKK